MLFLSPGDQAKSQERFSEIFQIDENGILDFGGRPRRAEAEMSGEKTHAA
jgi:hypothetical protein